MITLLRRRQLMMKEVIDEMVSDYLNQPLKLGLLVKRRCATCGKKFIPMNRNNFFCRFSGCRKEFYRGQFVRRK